jgi:hypothetical protein
MEIRMYKGVSPIKVVLVALFCILGMGEFLDGIYDVSDFAVPLLLLLALNDIFVVSKKHEEENCDVAIIPKGEVIGLENNNKSILNKNFNLGSVHKVIMNIVFILLLLSPLLLEALGISNYYRKEIYRIGIIIWSAVFLIVSLVNIRKSFAFSKLIYCNVAACILLVTVFVF